MRFLGGLLKFLAILILVAATAICVAVAVAAGVMEAYLVMGLSWVCALFVALNILGTGIALTRLRKLEKKVELLEQRLLTQPAAPAAPDALPEVQPQPSVRNNNEDYAPKPKKSKVWIPIVIVAVVAVIAVVAAVLLLGGDKQVPAEEIPSQSEAETIAPAEEGGCAITINGICVDDSYVDDDGSPLRMVYLFYTISTDGENLQIDSKYTDMIIGSNTYTSDNFADSAAACKYAFNYYYGSYIRDVYVGSPMNVIATFKIPEGDLEGGKTITFADSQIPGIEGLSMSTDEIMHFGAPEEIAAVMDPEGFERAMYAREDADSDTVRQVKEQINGYCWSFYVNNMSYEIEFWADNNFVVRTSFGTESYGTYTVQNGYVFCTYPDTGYTVEIPYTLTDGSIDLDVIEGFDVN